MAGGRPLKFTSVEKLQQQIDDYFTQCKEDKEFPTISGLALSLDVCTDTLRNYEQKGEFFATIKKAKQKVEVAWERQLLSPGSGPIFWLKNNAGWRDKTEQEISGEMVNKIEYEIIDTED